MWDREVRHQSHSRLQDPLAELVKIDPKSIGVGQYQHDMNQKKLGESLNGVVEDCVNKVGVDLNTASAPLLSYISGISSDNRKKYCGVPRRKRSFYRQKRTAKSTETRTESVRAVRRFYAYFREVRIHLMLQVFIRNLMLQQKSC